MAPCKQTQVDRVFLYQPQNLPSANTCSTHQLQAIQPIPLARAWYSKQNRPIFGTASPMVRQPHWQQKEKRINCPPPA
jgi:hypothetical protein